MAIGPTATAVAGTVDTYGSAVAKDGGVVVSPLITIHALYIWLVLCARMLHVARQDAAYVQHFILV